MDPAVPGGVDPRLTSNYPAPALSRNYKVDRIGRSELASIVGRRQRARLEAPLDLRGAVVRWPVDAWRTTEREQKREARAWTRAEAGAQPGGAEEDHGMARRARTAQPPRG
jgi:hypothetical protein